MRKGCVGRHGSFFICGGWICDGDALSLGCSKEVGRVVDFPVMVRFLPFFAEVIVYIKKTFYLCTKENVCYIKIGII